MTDRPDFRRGVGRPSVIYADDSKRERDALDARFALRAFELVGAANPDEALALLESPAAAVLVAVHEPIDAASLLTRARDLRPDVYRVLVTASPNNVVALTAVNEAAVHRIVPASAGRQRLDDVVAALVERARADRMRVELARRAEQSEAELTELRASVSALSVGQGTAVLEVLMSALCMREGSAISHSHRAAHYAAKLGRACGLPARDVALVELGVLLHDVGKLALSDRLLDKPGTLNKREWVQMRKHPALGDDLLAELPLLATARPIVLQHHERWDGGGYPTGLTGPEIHVGARICAVADTLDAMTTTRTYREAVSFERAWDEILACRGTQFDPAIVDCFEALGPDDWERAVTETAAVDQPTPLRHVLEPLVGLNWRGPSSPAAPAPYTSTSTSASGLRSRSGTRHPSAG